MKLHVWGEYACFTRPEMKVERVSYDVMTPCAAPGLNDVEIELADDGQGPALRLRRQVPDKAVPEQDTAQQRWSD